MNNPLMLISPRIQSFSKKTSRRFSEANVKWKLRLLKTPDILLILSFSFRDAMAEIDPRTWAAYTHKRVYVLEVNAFTFSAATHSLLR